VFHPIAAETQGRLDESARDLLSDFGRRIAVFWSPREFFLFQRVSVASNQLFNYVFCMTLFVLRISQTDYHSRQIVLSNF